jgi:hypothetical protein
MRFTVVEEGEGCEKPGSLHGCMYMTAGYEPPMET